MGAPSTPRGSRPGLRRGAWTAEEDALLRVCMEKYGAVRWSLVPERAGLNRCPKSCRLRWLNYPCPSIKRGKFEDAEVDLIIRLHKLLGNRWSLIAGRIPGRTANDVKNHWNTHLSKQLLIEREEKEASTRYVEVVKPQPQTIPWKWKWLKDAEACPGKQHQEEPDISKQPSSPNNHATCIDSMMDTENVNFCVSNTEVGMTEEVQTKVGFEDMGSFRDYDFLLEGFNWEDMQPDISLWRDFEFV